MRGSRAERAAALCRTIAQEIAAFAPAGRWNPNLDALNPACDQFLDVLDAWERWEPHATRERVLEAYAAALDAWRREAERIKAERAAAEGPRPSTRATMEETR